MAHILHLIQVISALALIALVLLQRTAGDMGSSTDTASFAQTRRGAERFFFLLTVLIAVIFVGSSLAVIMVK